MQLQPQSSTDIPAAVQTSCEDEPTAIVRQLVVTPCFHAQKRDTETLRCVTRSCVKWRETKAQQVIVPAKDRSRNLHAQSRAERALLRWLASHRGRALRKVRGHSLIAAS